MKITLALTLIAGTVLVVFDTAGRWLDSDSGAGQPNVEVVPATATLAVGDSVKLRATLVDDSGNEVSGERFSWWSPDRHVAAVGETGVVTAVAVGAVTIAAITEDRSQSGFADVTVVAAAQNEAEGNPPAAANGESERKLHDDAPRQLQFGAAVPGPNEPEGFVEQVRRPFDAYNENGWRDRHQGGNQRISDGAMRITYPAGYEGGYSPGSSGVYFGKDQDGFRSVYLAHDLLLSANWQGHGSKQNKIWYFNTPNGNRTILTVKAYGGKGATEFPMVPTAGQTKNSVAGRGKGSNLYQNSGGPKVRRGTRAFVEILVTLNSAPSTHDGELHIWIDGAKTHEFTPRRGNGINWYDEGEGSRIGQVKWTPVWGGIGDRVQSPMYMEMSGVYISAR